MRRQAVVEKEWILKKPIEEFVADEINLEKKKVSRLCQLFKEGCESAYIARYRGEVHGGLPPEDIRKAMSAYCEAMDLNKKVSSALSTITAKVEGVGEKKEVAERLKMCEDVVEVNEIAKEFSAGTRKTKANVARELGMEPAARLVLEGGFVDLKALISNDVKTEKEVKEHFKICLADLINRDEEVKKIALQISKLEVSCGLRITAKLSKDAAKKKEDKEMQRHLEKYKLYIGLNQNAKTLKDHQISAMNRAVEEGMLTWSADLPEGEARRLHPFSKKRLHNGMQNVFQEALTYSIVTYFSPKVERGTKKFLTTRAMAKSIQVFGENVEQLFAQEGVHGKYVIALDPGSMIKTAFLKPNGAVIAMDQFAIQHTQFDRKGVDLLRKWVAETKGKDVVIAIGNGSNTYNTQCAVARMIESREFKGADVSFCVVPECGASKYSCTPAALEEFGENTDIKQISAVSIGRRLIDPMSEYVKIEPQHLGQGQYQLSADEKQLKQKLAIVVRDRVSLIGADLNQASKHLLAHICGLNESTAKGIVKFREEHGPFRSREQLKKVKGIGAVAFQQSAGFLRVENPEISDEGPPAKRKKSGVEWCPLDRTIVHPDDYDIAEKVLKKLKMSLEEVTSGRQISSEKLAEGLITEKETNILSLMTSKPDLKPPPPLLKKVRATRDLAVGQKFSGVVRNKTDFGVFVDIGVERDGLVHISQFRNGQRPVEREDLPTVGDVIEVVVGKVEGNKIGLNLAQKF